MDSINWPCSGHRSFMSAIWPVYTGRVPDMDLSCPKYGQIFLATFRTSHTNVRNRASINWPYSGHWNLMSGIWPVETGRVPDIKMWCPECDQDFWPCSGHHWPYSGHHWPCSRHHWPCSGLHWPYSGHKFRFKIHDRNTASWYSGHQRSMCGTWPRKTGLIVDNGYVAGIADVQIMARVG